MAILNTHKAVQKLEDAGAPEPLAVATVEVVTEGVDEGTKKLLTRESLYWALLIQTGVIIAIAGVSLTIAQWMFN